MAEQFKKGDEVEWKTSQGKTTGEVEQTLTKPTEVSGRRVAASKDNPEYLVKSDKSGKEAAHKPESLEKKRSKRPSGDIEHTRWRYSLMNWGHDPLK